jgi:hypothetical protein
MEKVFEKEMLCPHENLTVKVSHDRQLLPIDSSITIYGRITLDSTPQVSHDRQLLPNASAIIFHGRAFNGDDLPERAVDQKWIFDSQESPWHDYNDGTSDLNPISTPF